ncbi:MAG: prephenate dehydratase [Dehalococcoidia bacterium]
MDAVKRLAYLGPAGTFTEQAARNYDPQARLVPFSSIPGVAVAVGSNMADEGVVPIENSLEGSVTDTLDLLIREAHLFIRHELVLRIEQCLLVKQGTEATQVQVIYSHPQALSQCRQFVERCFPKAQAVAALSTAAAVEDMLNASTPAAAIAPQRAAEIYGAEVLAASIQDVQDNVTRFIVLAREDHLPTGKDKTSLCFSFAEDKPGLLYSIMGEFAQRDINLAKVESRPTKQSLGQYIFLIDLEGHRTDPPVQEALEGLRRQVSMLKVFGSYPRAPQV